MQPTMLRLDDDIKKRAQAQAHRDYVSLNKLVHYALLAYLDEKEEEREATEQA